MVPPPAASAGPSEGCRPRRTKTQARASQGPTAWRRGDGSQSLLTPWGGEVVMGTITYTYKKKLHSKKVAKSMCNSLADGILKVLIAMYTLGKF